MNRFANQLSANLGTCVFCIRRSFHFAACTWAASVFLSLTGATHVATIGTAVASLATALWFAHLLAYASRNVTLSPLGAIALEPTPLFFKSLMFISSETATFFPKAPTDRSGASVKGRAYLVQLKNEDGSRTAYFKTSDDVLALTRELKARGFAKHFVDPGYWMSTDSCERSAGTSCKDNTCDVSTKTCKQQGVGMTYCRCV